MGLGGSLCLARSAAEYQQVPKRHGPQLPVADGRPAPNGAERLPLQGATRQEKDHWETVLAEWLEAAEIAVEPTMVGGDLNAIRDELDISGG